MEDQEKERDVKKNGYFSQIKKINFKNYAVSLILISLVILIWGYFYSIQKEQWKAPKFPTKIYENASKKYTKLKETKLINQQVFYEEILIALSNIEKPIAISDILSKLNKSNKSKIIVLQQIDSPYGMNEKAQIKNKYDESRKIVNEKIEAETDYYKRRALQALLNNYDQLLEFSQNAKMLPYIYFPKSNYINNEQRESFTFAAGTLTQIDYHGNHLICAGDFSPVIKPGFLKKAGLSLNSEIKEQLKRNGIQLDKIKDIAKEEFKNNVKNEKRKISEKRKYIRNSFYGRWYSTVILLIVSFFMFRILIRFYSIIRRKSLSKKTTHDVYFATNTTSIIFRWVALIVIILGILSLIINALSAIISGTVSGFIPIPLLHSATFFYKILHPIFSTIFTIIASWLFVLISEHICFMSNVYHIVFEKVYGKIGD